MRVKETAEIETGMAENSSWDWANRRQKHALIKKKIKFPTYIRKFRREQLQSHI
jgi:hypothetical protein